MTAMLRSVGNKVFSNYPVVLAQLAVALLVILACANGFVALVAAVVLAAVITAAFAPRTFVLISALAMLFVRTLQHRVPISGVEYLDEFCVLVAVVVLPATAVVQKRELVRVPGARWFVLFFALGIASAVVHDVPFDVLLDGVFLASKGFLFGWAVAQVEWRVPHLAKLARIGAAIAVFLLSCAAINLIAPGFWNTAVLGISGFGRRFGLPPITGPFVHPGYFGTTMVLIAVSVAAYRLLIARNKASALLLAFTVGCAILTFRRKVLAGFIAAYAYVRSKGGFSSTAVMIFWSVPALLVGGGMIAQTISYTYTEYFANPNAVARIRLYLDSINLGAEYFPFGAGFGRFGSAAARSHYSPEYYDLGYPSVWGLGPTEETGKFLTDTFWPAVLGEAGILGLLAYLSALWCVFRVMNKAFKAAYPPHVRWIALVAAAWTIELLIESIAGAVFTAAPTYGLFFGIVGIAASAITSAEKNNERKTENLTEVTQTSEVQHEFR